MSAEKRFDLDMINDVAEKVDAARTNEALATKLLIDSSQSAEQRAQWEQVAADELENYEAKKTLLGVMREEALRQAGSKAA